MNQINKSVFVKSVLYIHANLDKPILLDNIAKDAGLSLSSLKRMFVDVTNQSAGCFIRRLRMERAFRTLKSKEESILEVALNSGFDDHSAFTRAFKDYFGYAPSYAREKINIVSELECVSLKEPEMVELNPIYLQSVTHTGSYFEAAPSAWESLKSKLSPDELSDDFLGTFIGIGHDNPHNDEAVENKVRFSAGVSYCNRELELETLIIEGGNYAKFSFIGKVNNLGLAYHYIYGTWLEKSKRVINHNKAAFMVFDRFPESSGEHTISIYAPLVA